MLKKLLSHAAIYGLAPYITKVVSFFILPVITQDLTAKDYGVAGLVTSYTGLFTVISSLGLPVILSNSFVKHEQRYPLVWRHVYGFLSLWNIIYGLIIALMLYLLLQTVVQENDLYQLVALSVGPIILFGPTQAIGSLYYQLNHKPFEVVWRSTLFGLLTIALNVYLISILKLGFLGWFWTDFIVGILFNASYWWSLNIKLNLSPIYRIRWPSIKRYLKTSLPIIPHQYASFLLRSSDRAVLGFLQVAPSLVGKYTLAGNFGNYFYSVSAAFSTAANPFLLKDLKANRMKRVRSMIYLIQLLMLSGTFLFCLWSKQILQFLIRNEELKLVYPLVIVVVMAFNYRPMYIASTSVLFFFEKTKHLLKISFIAGIANVILNLTLIPIFGFQFAAYSTFICYMYVGYSGFFLKQYTQHVSLNFFPLRWLSVTVMLTLLAYYAVEFSVLNKAFLSIVSLGCFVFFGWLIKRDFYEINE